MTKRSKKPADLNRLAAAIVGDATDETPPEPETLQARAGRAGGRKGGKVRAERMTAEQRSSAARKAAKAGKYSPAVCMGTKKLTRKGDPNPDRISTSYVERQNLTMRMGMRRFTRLTNGFSRKVENLAHAVSLHFMHYNFARPHQALKERYPRTPAMAAGVTDHVWNLEEIAALLD